VAFIEIKSISAVLFLDKLTVHINGQDSRHNVSSLRSENPYVAQELKRDSLWCGLTSPLFFAEQVTTGSVNMLENDVAHQVEELQPAVIFQQDRTQLNRAFLHQLD
jgi:hypothetical protein